MRHRVFIVLGMIALAAHASRSGAQSLAGLSAAVGKRVRVRAGSADAIRTGTLMELGDSTISLQATEGPTVIARRAIVSVDVSTGHARLAGGLKGALVGGGIGLVAGAVLGGATTRRDDELRGLAIAFATGFAGVIGIGTGAIVGAVRAPEEWQPIFPRP